MLCLRISWLDNLIGNLSAGLVFYARKITVNDFSTIKHINVWMIPDLMVELN